MKRSRLIALSTLAGATWLLLGGCSSSADNGASPNGPSNTSGASVGGGGGSTSQPTAGSSGSGGSGKTTLNPLCGVADAMGECVPDNPSACLGYLPPNGVGGESATGEGGASGAASGMGGAEQGGAEQGGERGNPGAAGQAGASSHEGGAGAGGQASGQAGAADGGAAGEGGANGNQPPALASYSCQVTSQNNLLTRQCVAAGSGTVNAPCFGPADCAPSYACVTDGDAGRCLPYCCNAGTTCAPGTYCAEQPLRKSTAGSATATPPRVPVCVPADGCSLEDKFPCPAGSTCRCQGDTACMVVRSDGTTACVKPGTGQEGDACPCAWNHVCSSVSNTCVKICRTDASDSDCGAQKCQASAELPPNFGVCVGPLN